MSYVAAILTRGIVGVIVIYTLAPWKVGFGFSKPTIKQLLRFGLPYQANTLMAMAKDRFLNLLLFRIIGAHGMGVIGWAQTWSQKPLRFISDNVTKVTFPAFSRLQTDYEELSKAINKMLFFSSVLIFPVLVGAGVIAKPLVEIIPKYQKWEPALLAFYLYLFNSGWAAISTPITNTIAAIGHIKLVSKLMVMWTVLTWTIIAPLAYFYGYNGVAMGVAIVAVSSIVPIWLLYRKVKFDLLNNVIKPLAASIIMGAGVKGLLIAWSELGFMSIGGGTVKLMVSIAGGVVIYSVALHFITGKELLQQIKIFVKAMKK